MKVSIASSVYVNYSLQDTIRRVARAGYDGIDIWGGRPHAYRSDYSRDELRQLRALVDDLGMIIPAFMPAFFRYPHSLSSPNDIVRQDSIDYMRACMENATILGAPIVLVVPGQALAGQSREDAWHRLTDSVGVLCEEAVQAGLKLAIEPVNREVSNLLNTSGGALLMIEELQYHNLGVALDTGHLHLTGESPDEAVHSLGDRLFQVHVNDNDGRHQQNLIPGEGTFDFPGFVCALHRAGYVGVVTAELGWHHTLDPDPAVHRTLCVLRELFP